MQGGRKDGRGLPFKLPERSRLRGQAAFERVYEGPRKCASQYFVVLSRHSQQPFPRIGIVMPRHRMPRAVDRNAVRRIVRESFRLQQSPLKGFDIIVLIRTKCTPLNKLALRKDIDFLWQKLATPSHLL